MTKIDVISGFLGAGKTTFIKKLIQEAYQGEQVVLIENEFGEIGVDAGFLKDAGIEIKEMNSGCICCSLVGDFASSLAKVVEEYHPDRIVIEPSGVGKLSDVVKAIMDVKEDLAFEINCLSVVVDAKKAKMYMKNFGEFFNNQIENATTVILSRTQMVSEEKLSATLDLIRELNPNAHVVTTPWDQLDGKDILKVMQNEDDLAAQMMAECHHHEHDEECCCGHHHHEHDEECCGHHHHEHDEECCGHHHHEHDEECCGHHHHEHDEECCGHHHHEHDEECCCGHHHHEHDEECGCGHHHHADEVFTSLGVETNKTYSKARLESLLNELTDEKYGHILRAKGMLADENGVWHYFDFVPEEFEIREGSPCYTGRICVIGSEMDEKAIKALFEME